MNKPIIYKVVDGEELMTVVVINGIIATTSILLKDWKGKYFSELYKYAKANNMRVEELK